MCRGMGLEIDGTLLYTLLFADNQIVIAGNNYNAEYTMSKLIEIYKMAGMNNSSKW